MKQEAWKIPVILNKTEDEWLCKLDDGREISLILNRLDDDSEEENYINETIEITFWAGDEQLGSVQDVFKFYRTGFVVGIENQSFLFENIFMPECLRGSGLSQTAVEMFKEYTGGASISVQDIYIRNENPLLEPGYKFTQRMKGKGLINSDY